MLTGSVLARNRMVPAHLAVVMLIFASLFMGAACSKQETASEGADAVSEATNTVPPSVEEQSWAAIRAGAQLIDVRTPGEFSGGYLDGAVNIPHDQIASRVGELDDDKDRTIVVYCRSGGRASAAKQTLMELGYTQVINGGGYESLKRAE